MPIKQEASLSPSVSITELCQNAARCVREVCQSGRPLVIIKNSRPVALLVATADAVRDHHQED